MTDEQRISAIIEFWFADLDVDGMPNPAQNMLWFQAGTAIDQRIADQFGAQVRAALQGELDYWATSDRGLLALVLLLDQFTRNIYRHSAAAFSGDVQALKLARSAVAAATDRRLATIERVFLYLPFEHAEDLQAQDQGIACFDNLLAECPANARERVADFRRYAVAHRQVIERFGRFPHRNSILGRTSSGEELNHLRQHGGF